jgi:hypothetical protein
MRHLELAEIARMLAGEPPFPEACHHLAEACPECGTRLREVEALMKRFGHWSPEIAVQEGLDAVELFAGLLATGRDYAEWRAEVERREELQTWAVAWLALERTRELFAENGEPNVEVRDLALLAALIAENLGEPYHPEWVNDLKALAYALAAAAEPLGAGSVEARLKHLAAAVAALEKGTGEEHVAREVWELLSRVLRPKKKGGAASAPPLHRETRKDD